jgi:hypothetical protein
MFKPVKKQRIYLKNFAIPLDLSLRVNQKSGENWDDVLKNLGTLANESRIGESLEAVIIFKYFEDHDKYCLLTKDGRGNQSGCGSCNLLLYRLCTKKYGNDRDQQGLANSWILKRKVRGRFIQLLHSLDDPVPTHLCYYFDGLQTTFLETLNHLPCMDLFDDHIARKKLKILRDFHMGH